MTGRPVASVTSNKKSNSNYVTIYAIAGPKSPIMYESRLQRCGHYKCINFVVISKWIRCSLLMPAHTKQLYASRANSVSRVLVWGLEHWTMGRG